MWPRKSRKTGGLRKPVIFCTDSTPGAVHKLRHAKGEERGLNNCDGGGGGGGGRRRLGWRDVTL